MTTTETTMTNKRITSTTFQVSFTGRDHSGVTTIRLSPRHLEVDEAETLRLLGRSEEEIAVSVAVQRAAAKIYGRGCRWSIDSGVPGTGQVFRGGDAVTGRLHVDVECL
jgi:hypothetical protein